jgi:nucleotide-binding universal stress UspA family protein
VGNGAVEVAYALADAGTTVHLLYVMEPAEIAALQQGRWAPAYLPTPEERRGAEERVLASLSALAPVEAMDEGVRTEAEVLTGRPVADRIEEAAERHHADVVVMGTHGRTGIGRVLMGSVATAVMKRMGSVPVLLVHADRVGAAPPP